MTLVNKDYWFYRERRDAVLERDKKCVYCQTPLSIYTATLDHLIPKGKGGTDDLSNLVLACKTCNNQKSDLLPLEFILKKLEPVRSSLSRGQRRRRNRRKQKV